MQRNTVWTIAAAATVAGALATLPTVPVALGGSVVDMIDPTYRCYPASGLRGATGKLPMRLTGVDAIGPFNVTLTKAKSYCTPAMVATPGINVTLIKPPPVVCFATKDLERPAFPSDGIVINVTVKHVGDLGLRLKRSKLTCLPVAEMMMK